MYASGSKAEAGLDWDDNGNIGSFDYDETSLTERDAYQPMMLMGVVPANTKLILLRVRLLTTAADKKVCFRHPDMSNDINISSIVSQVANVPIERDVWVSCDANCIVDVLIDTATWTQIGIAVRGWSA